MRTLLLLDNSQDSGVLRSAFQKGMDVAALRPRHVDTEATDAQKEAGNYRMAHVRWNGLDITIENPRGSTRTKTSAAMGKRWSRKMAHHYGYIRGTTGVDNDHVDVFLGPDLGSDHVFVVHQVDQAGQFDEHKCMLGFETEAEARAGYLANYDKGWKVGPVKAMSVAEFKRWLQHIPAAKVGPSRLISKEDLRKWIREAHPHGGPYFTAAGLKEIADKIRAQSPVHKAFEAGKAAPAPRGMAEWQHRQKRHYENLASKRQGLADWSEKRLADGDLPAEKAEKLRGQVAEDKALIAKYRGVHHKPEDADYWYHSSPQVAAMRKCGLRSAPYHDSATGETRRQHVVWVTEDDQGARLSGTGGYGDVVRVHKDTLREHGLHIGQSGSGEDIIRHPSGKPFAIPPHQVQRYYPGFAAWAPLRRAGASGPLEKAAGASRNRSVPAPPVRTVNAPGLPYDNDVTHITTPEGAHGILTHGFNVHQRGGIRGESPNDYGPGLYAGDTNSDVAGHWRNEMERSGESGERASTALRGRARLEKPMYVDDRRYGPDGRSTAISHREFLQHGNPSDGTPGHPASVPHYDEAVAAGLPSGHALALAARATGHDGLVLRRYRGEEVVAFHPHSVSWSHVDGDPIDNGGMLDRMVGHVTSKAACISDCAQDKQKFLILCAIDPKDSDTPSLFPNAAKAEKTSKPRYTDADRARNVGAGLQERYKRAETAYRGSMHQGGHYTPTKINQAVLSAQGNVIHPHFLTEGRQYLHQELYGAHRALNQHEAGLPPDSGQPTMNSSPITYPAWEERHPGGEFDPHDPGPAVDGTKRVKKALRAGLRTV